MIELTAASLRQFSPNLDATRAELYAKVLGDACALAEITTPRRLWNFLGQVGEETGGLRSLVESTKYGPGREAFLAKTFSNVHGADHATRLIAGGPEAIGNTIYAGKNGNGDVESGDGYRYRGRGFLQVTGRGNYRMVGKMMDLPVEDDPDMLGQPTFAAQSAARFWKVRGINDAADADDVGMVTQLVNGGARLHLAERRQWHHHARRIWPA